ncbi:hypothetical protein PPERSA_06777 [Pseudocohnilembus persalinus]|uniref:Uncharacterized protein n=1 Tax=Pseudocohnilembus persalinus TaxID=266149 RepID=A0A0V0QSI5_PSEPJ|nr:hypothetical protein PPERSA_06777 [Pseudocohnilembus persalinus]|eukprot:KRX05143.1 hypothetical protein PPERSA_06777 [Pseudocohnilembus persalinus]
MNMQKSIFFLVLILLAFLTFSQAKKHEVQNKLDGNKYKHIKDNAYEDSEGEEMSSDYSDSECEEGEERGWEKKGKKYAYKNKSRKLEEIQILEDNLSEDENEFEYQNKPETIEEFDNEDFLQIEFNGESESEAEDSDLEFQEENESDHENDSGEEDESESESEK